MFDDDRSDRFFKTFLGAVIFWGFLSLCFDAGVLFIILHFVFKYWN